MHTQSSWFIEIENNETLKDFYTKEAMEQVGAMAILDKNFHLIYINDKYAQTMGVDKAASLGKSIYDVIDNTNMTSVAFSQKPEFGVLYRRHNMEFILNKYPIFKDGEVVGVVGVSIIERDKRISSLKSELDNLSKEISHYREKNYRRNPAKYDIDMIVSINKEMMNLKSLIYKVAPTKSTVLIIGESGTGKELFAHSIHLLSNRSKMPFIRINCSTIPENLIESELFGYEKGSFTGALKEGKKGMFEEAEGGTILLDEIDSLPLSLQPKLLRVLQEKEFRRIGGSETINVDVRMIFTSNKDLFSLVKYGQFREDLYYRINVVNLNIPPLKDRKDDIPVLVEEFVRKFNSEFSLNILGVSDMTMELLMAHDWPGNVRELENAIERAFIYANGDVLTSEHFDIELPPEENNELFNETIYDGRHLREIVSEVERKAIGEALIATNGNKKRAAELLGIDRSVLYDKLRTYEMFAPLK